MVLYDLYVIYNEGGRCIHHYRFGGLNVNSELVGSFLDALSSFAMETIPSKGQMRLVDRGDVKIIFEKGKHVTLALFASEDSTDSRGLLLQFLSQFENSYANVLEKWDGSLDAFDGLDDLIKSVFKRERVSLQIIPANSIPKPISLQVAASKIEGQNALAVIRAAVQNSVSGILSIMLNPSASEPVGYISILKGNGYAAYYMKPYSKVRKGTDAARHIIFDSLTFPAWIRFRITEDAQVESEVDSATNRIDVPLYGITLDIILLSHHYDRIKGLKPKSKASLSVDEVHKISGVFGDIALNILKTSQGRLGVEQLAVLHGISVLEITEIIVWTASNGFIEMIKD